MSVFADLFRLGKHGHVVYLGRLADSMLVDIFKWGRGEVEGGFDVGLGMKTGRAFRNGSFRWIASQ